MPARTRDNDYVISLHDLAAADADRVGPKAANLAALAQAGLPTPGGFCFTADAYRRQIDYLALAEQVDAYRDADPIAQRRLAVEIRLQLYQSDLAPDLKEHVAALWQSVSKPAAVRSSALIEDRADAGFAGQFESFLGLSDKDEFSSRPARLLGRTVDDQCASDDELKGPLSERHRHGRAHSAPDRRDRVRRRPQQNGRR